MRLYFIYGDEFGERVIGNLLNYSTFCESCGLLCEHCRTVYPSYASDFEGVFKVDTNLPTFIDEPEKYLPPNLGLAEVLIVVGVHIDLLLTIPKLVIDSKVKGVIAPIENRHWCPPAVKNRVKNELNEIGVESAFPKPFCSLEKPGNGGVIDRFIDRYKIGRPELKVKISKGVIREATVLRSAPCGSTWYIARQIRLRDVKGIEEVTSKAHHTYPCTASMEVDKEIGDTILHKAGYIIREEVLKAIKNAQQANS
ncbi:MAG: DUF166 domain-containing protein [Candidatus Bathyarchaeota archaeon]